MPNNRPEALPKETLVEALRRAGSRTASMDRLMADLEAGAPAAVLCEPERRGVRQFSPMSPNYLFRLPSLLSPPVLVWYILYVLLT